MPKNRRGPRTGAVSNDFAEETCDGKAERKDGTGHRFDRRGRPARRSQARASRCARAAEDGHYSTNPRLSVNEDPCDAPPNAGAEEAAATGNEPVASSVPVLGAPERDNKWPDGTQ